jgi:hypothetical protein
MGNFGDNAYGSTLDYGYQGDCEWVYLYDGSPLIARFTGIEYKADFFIHSDDRFKRPLDGQPKVPTASTSDYEVFETGTFVTNEGNIALEMTWYSPTASDSCNFVIQCLKLYSWDGSTNENVAIGQAIDWDIPAETGANNTGGSSSNAKMIYQRGTGNNCIDNDTRFGGQALIGITYENGDCMDTSVTPYAGYTGLNSVDIWPYGGFVAEDVYNQMQVSGYNANPTAADQYSLMTFLNDETIGPDDTIYVYSALATTWLGNESILIDYIMQARKWTVDYVAPACGLPSCCIGRVGDANDSGEDDPTIGDVSIMIDALFVSSNMSLINCLAEADVNQSGGADPQEEDITIGDISYLIDYLFITGESLGLPDCL